jgi:putative transposase
MRKPRHLVEGAWYHVTVRANRREMLLDRGEVRDLFLHFLARVKKRYRFEVSNFCVMGNHVHLLVRPREGESLSAIMRWLLGYFARAYNKKRGWTGHFWGDRFHSRVINGIRDFVIAFGYIDENPVKAGLVGKPVEWRHGGAWHSLRGGGCCLDPFPPWLAFLAVARALPTGIA